jgi:glutamate racemase
MNSQPIGVFDSGLGGLTVLRELIRAFPHETFYYLGDTARLPYGTKTPETIKKYVLQNLNFLDQHNCKAFVVACNSASTQVDFLDFNGKPVYSVIDPGVEWACKVTQNKLVGLIATEATVKSEVYQKKIFTLDSQIQVFTKSCGLFVPLVEEGWHEDPVTNIIVFRYLQELKKKQIDTLILGCTHYPILEKSIQNVMGNSVRLVDSGRALVEKLRFIFPSHPAEKSEEINPESQQIRPVQNLIVAFTDVNTKTETTTLNILAQGLDQSVFNSLNFRFEIVSL